MHRLVVAVLVVTLAAPASRAAAGAADPAGSVSGTAHASTGRSVAHASVRLRDLTSGQAAATTTTDEAGAFSFTGVAPGQYTVELLDAAGQVVSSSAAVEVAAGAVTGVAVGSATGTAAAATSFFASPIGLLSVAAAGAAVAGVTVSVARPTASPSR